MKSKFLKAIVWLVVIPAVLSLAVMLLWNLVMPGLFGLPLIGFWQALGLFLLSKVLFGGFELLALGGLVHSFAHHRQGHLHEKWRGMTEEQRREFFEKRWNVGFSHFSEKNKHRNEQDSKDE